MNLKSSVKILQRKQAENYKQHAKDLLILEEGDVVHLTPYKLGSSVWQRAVVQKRLDEGSYEVETGSGLFLRRNRDDLNRTQELPPSIGKDQPSAQKTIPERVRP